MSITYERVRELFDYEPITGSLIWKNLPSSKCNTSFLGKPVGAKNSAGRYHTCIDGKFYYNSQLVFLYHHGYIPEHELDHINRDVSDDRIENLRELSRSCNAINQGNSAKNTSGVKGVRKHRNSWAASICLNQQSYHIGITPEFDEAVCMRLAAEQCLGIHGCDASSPAKQYVEKHIQKEL